MDFELRYAGPDEFRKVTDLDGPSFGFQYSEQDLEDAKLDLELDTILVAVEGERFVGVSGEVPFEMTLPGGRIDVTGLSWVSVEITHRRKGILRALMERQIREGAERGSGALILTASEGGIYGRYGFGNATDTRKVIVDRRGCRMLHPVEPHGVTRLSTGEARAVLPPIYDRWRRATPGGLDRNEKRWQLQLLDREHDRGGMSGLFHLVHDDGYVSYRIKSDWNDGHPRHAVWITDYVIASAQAHAALWQVLIGMDLSATIESFCVPTGDPLPYLLTDPRRVRTAELNDGLWVRPLDVAALLSARRYAVDLDVVLKVADPVLGDAVFRLRGGPDGASCERTDAHADLELGVADVGALCLGGMRLAPFVHAGRAQCSDAGVVTRVDRAFLADAAPQYGTHF